MKKYILSLLILLIAYYQGNSQGFAVEIRLNSEVVSRANMVAETTEIKALSSRHGVTLRQSFPNARNPELLLYYTLTMEGRRTSVENAESRRNRENVVRDFLATGKFESDVFVFGIAYTLCANPVSVNDPDFLNEHGWPLKLINAPCAWSITRGNPNILIGIADTEFRTTHEDLENRFASISGLSSAGNHHGTVVASVAAARTNNGRGVASIGHNSRIAAHRIVHYAEGRAYTENIRAAIMNLFNMGVPIINVSWSATGLNPAAAREITQNGTTLVLAGGNTPTSQSHSSIANIPGVIVVSSVNQNNMHGPTNHARNQWIDIVAPGTNIRVAGGGSDFHYFSTSGTSLAAPFVAGTVALMLSVNPNLTPVQIENIIKITADPIADGHLFPGQLGAGRLNAHAAVTFALSPPTIAGSSVVCCESSIFTLQNSPLPDGAVHWSITGPFSISNATNTQVIVTQTSSGTGGTLTARRDNNRGSILAIRTITACQALFFTNQVVRTNRTITHNGNVCIRNVSVINDARLLINAAGEVFIGENFEVATYSTFEIR